MNKSPSVKKFDPAVNFSRSAFKAITTPEFYKNFKCIGSECENHCCHHWNITVDRETYQQYKKHGDIKIRQVANKQTKSCGQHGIDYRQIKLQSNGDCPFLDEDKLCYIHKNHGEDLLPATCKIYPREDKLIDGRLYNSLSISCPEAARKILLDPSAMNIKHTPVLKNTDLPKFASKLILPDSQLQKQFKQAAYNCLSAENCDTVEGRLFNLGFLFRLTSQRINANQSIETLLSGFDDLIISGDLNQQYQDTLPAQKAQEFVLQKLLQEVGFGAGNAVFFQYKKQALDQLIQSDSFNKDTEQINLTDYYVKHCQQGYETLVDEHGHAFINLMLHWVYSTPFSLTDNKAFFDQFAFFTLKFFYIRTLCGILRTGMDNPSSDKNEALLVGIVHSISRKADHDRYFSTLVYQSLIQQGLAQPEHILGLIKV
jgi:lysine-N-methylase